MSINNLCLQINSLVIDVMTMLDKNGSGVCFVMEDSVLVGIITDGDMRRGIINGAILADPIANIVNKEFFSLNPGASLQTIQKALETYNCIPILDDSNHILDFVTAERYHHIPLVQPKFDGNELEYVSDCLQTGWISSQGSYVSRFEDDFGHYVGNENTLAVSNGTVALHLALVTLGIGPGDEVIVPALTFAAVINAVLYVGATPVIVDVEADTLNLDPALVLSAVNKKTRAIIAVHLYGHPAAMSELMTIAHEHNLLVVEDCAEALGSFYNGKHVGSLGHAAIFSFFGNKTITTGEGGILQFKDSAMKDRAKKLRDHGMSTTLRYWHDEVGFNYRMTNVQAAIGVAQLERIDHFVSQKRWIADRYKHYLSGINAITLPIERSNVQNSFWLYTIILAPEYADKRDQILASLKLGDVEARPIFYPLHQMPPYEAFVGDTIYPVSNALSEGGISLPSSISVTDEEIVYVCDRLVTAIHAVINA